MQARTGDTEREVSVAKLAELFDISEDKASLIWRIRAETEDERSKIWNNRFAGKVAGSLTQKYRQIRFKIDGVGYRSVAHRVLWALGHGSWPPRDKIVDHKNGVGFENAPSNTRIATDCQNQQNRRLAINNKTGFKGVFYCKRDQSFIVYLTANRKRMCIGYFKDAREAANAYDAAARKHHGEFAKTNLDLGLLK